MAPRSSIIAGQSVIVVQVQDLTNSAFTGIERNFKAFSSRLSRIGFELFSGGLFGSLGTGFIIKQFKDLEDELLFLKTKLQPTDKEFADITETIRHLGRTTSFTAKQVAEGATILAQAGFKASEVQHLLLPTLDLARGSQVELSAAGAILANTLRSFSLEASQAGDVASQFSAAARLGTLDVLDLKESIKEVLGTARGLNIDLPTTLGLITQLAERSLKGTKAGTSLNTALLNLASKGKMLKTLGLSLPDNINGGDFLRFLEQLQQKLKAFGNVKQVTILQRLFNIRGARAITALDDLKSLTNIIKEIKNAGTEARRTAELMDSKFGGALRRASASGLSLGLTLGKIVNEGLEPMVRMIPPVVAGLEKLADANKKFVFFAALTPPALLATGAGLLVAGFAASKFAQLIGLAGLAARTTAGAIGGILIKNLTTLAIVTDRSRKALKGLDQGLASALLPVILTGGRGRNAKKPKKTSFVGRVGNFNLSPAGIIKTTVLLEAAILKLIGLTGTFLTSLPKLIGQGAGLMSVALTKYITIVNKIDDLFKKKASFTFFDLQNTFKGKFKNPFAGVGTLLAGIKLRNPIILFQKLASVIERSFVAVRVFQKVLFFTFSSGASKSLFKAGNAIAAFIEKIQFGKGISSLASASTKGFFSALRLLTTGSFSLVKGLFNIFTFTGKVATGFLRAANVFRRFAFSFTGFLTIIELLIIFGPKIDFIRNAFVRLGKGFSEAFKSLGTVIADIKPAFKLFSIGFSQLFKGDAEKGLSTIIDSLGFMVDIIGIRISAAWNEVFIAISPAYDMMKKFILSTLQLGKLFGSLFGSTIGNGFSGISNAIESGFTGGKSFSEIVTNIFSAENMKSVFSGIGAFFFGIADTLKTAISFMVHSVVDTMILLKSTIISVIPIIKSLATATGNGSTEDLLIKALQISNPGLHMLFGGKTPNIEKAMEEGTSGLRNSLKEFDSAIEKVPNEIKNALDKFSTKLDDIFGSNATSDAEKRKQAINDANLANDAQLQVALAANKGRPRGFGSRILPDRTNNILGSPISAAQVSTSNQVSKGIASTLEEQIIKKSPTLEAISRRNSALSIIQENNRQRRLLQEAGFPDATRTMNNPERKQAIKDLRKANIDLKLLSKKNRFGNIAAPQRATLADVAASSVGSFQQTRGNKFGVGTAKDIQSQQLNTLEQIKDNTGGASDSLSELTKRAQPLVFQ